MVSFPFTLALACPTCILDPPDQQTAADHILVRLLQAVGLIVLVRRTDKGADNGVIKACIHGDITLGLPLHRSMLLSLCGRCKQLKMKRHTPTSIFYPSLKKSSDGRPSYPHKLDSFTSSVNLLTPSTPAFLSFRCLLFSKLIERGA